MAYRFAVLPQANSIEATLCIIDDDTGEVRFAVDLTDVELADLADACRQTALKLDATPNIQRTMPRERSVWGVELDEEW